MSGYITRTGNLAKTPELRAGEKGSYTYARIIVTDRVRDGKGGYIDGETTGYDVAVSGSQAENLVATAEASGNIRITVSGRYEVVRDEYEGNVRVKHRIYADEVSVSLRGQTATVKSTSGTTPEVDPNAGEYGDDTPF